jgi:hypothetical protein
MGTGATARCLLLSRLNLHRRTCRIIRDEAQTQVVSHGDFNAAISAFVKSR